MSAVEALALAHAEGVRVSLAGDWFIRWQSPASFRRMCARRSRPPSRRSSICCAAFGWTKLGRLTPRAATTTRGCWRSWRRSTSASGSMARKPRSMTTPDKAGSRRCRFYTNSANVSASTAHCCAPFRLPTCGRRASDDEVPVMEAAPRVHLHPSVDSTVSARGFRAVARRRSKR
jgi:hypothetical protein